MICTMWIPRLIEPILQQRMRTRPVEFDPSPSCAIVCRAANRYPIAARIEALPLADLPAFLRDPFP